MNERNESGFKPNLSSLVRTKTDVCSFLVSFRYPMEINQKMPSQEHLNFINKLNDAKIPRQSQLIANRLFLKNFPREVIVRLIIR